jgi:hypothetical protein
MATRQAQLAEGGMESLMEQMLITAVIRSLETKTGEVSTNRVARPFDIVYDVIAEAIERSHEEIRAMIEEGMTLAEIVESHNGDVEEVRDTLIEALSELPNTAELDLEGLASDWLGLNE